MALPFDIPLTTFLGALPHFVAVLDGERRFVWVNRLDASLTSEDVLGVPVDEFIHPDWRHHLHDALARVRATGKNAYYEARAFHQGEYTAYFGTTIVKLPYDNGGERFLLVSQDVTETYEARRDLEQQQRRLQLALEATNTAFWDWDFTNGQFFITNPARTRLGIETEYISIAELEELTHPDHRKDIRVMREAMVTGHLDDIDHRVRMNTNQEYWLQVRGQLERDDNGQVLRAIGTAADVTERTVTERNEEVLRLQLQQAQKMESVGQLAGGIAHDFNNLLQIITSHLEFVTAGSSDDTDLEVINTAVGRASELVRRLLTYARRQPQQPRKVELWQLVESALALIARVIPENISIEASPCPGVVLVADPMQVEQVIVNLCLNARDALPEGGRIRVSCNRVTRPSSRGTNTEYWALVIEDSGPGFSEEVIRRAIEPFFTTKGPAHGGGMGLSVVDGIVSQHGGFLELGTSELGGALVAAYFPGSHVEAADIVGSDESRGLTTSPERRGVVLLAEDDEALRTLLHRALTAQGFVVVDAADGQEALEVARSRDDLDVVLADLIMPVLGGHNIAVTLRQERPALPIVLMTGYQLPELSDVSDAHAVLQKPFDVAELVNTLLGAMHFPSNQ